MGDKEQLMLEKLIVPIVAGLFGFIPVLIQWLSARGQARSRSTHISRLSSELAFLEQWIKLSRTGSAQERKAEDGPVPEAVQAELASILAEYKSLREKALEIHKRPTEVGFVRRALLLFRPLDGTGWFIHTTFYVLIAFAIAMILSDLQSPTFDPKTGENQFMYLLIGLLTIFVPLLVILQRAAIRRRSRGLARQQAIVV
jgi:hypothetical protein